MKRFTVEEKLSAIKDFETGMTVSEVCRKHNVNPNTFYKWKAKYDESGVDGLAPKVIIDRKIELILDRQVKLIHL